MNLVIFTIGNMNGWTIRFQKHTYIMYFNDEYRGDHK